MQRRKQEAPSRANISTISMFNMWDQHDSSKKMSGNFATMFKHAHNDRSGPSGSMATNASNCSSSMATSNGLSSKGKLGSSGPGGSSSALKGDKSSKGNNFVSRLGFKFDVANFDINAVSPTSW